MLNIMSVSGDVQIYIHSKKSISVVDDWLLFMLFKLPIISIPKTT